MHIYTGTSISFQGPTGFKTVASDHPKFSDIVNLCNDKDYSGAAALFDVKTVVESLVAGSDVKLVGSQLVYQGEVVSGLLGERIIKMANLGLSVDSLIAFLKNLKDNTSSRAVEELYGFLESSKLPITDDGHFLAYKSVRQDYTDHHSGKVFNGVGEKISMPRNKVNENKDQTCSYGLHFAAHEYAEGFGRGGRMMVMKINPRDVVSIPSDYNNQKGRCCAYEVIEEVERSDTKLVGATVVNLSPEKTSQAPQVTKDTWKRNTGTMPVAKGTRIDVKYLNKGDNFDVAAGGFESSDWDLDGVIGDILEWRLSEPAVVAPVATPVTKEIEKGSTVRLSARGIQKWYTGNDTNPTGIDGKVIEVRDIGFAYRVKWNNGEYNTYETGDLDLVAPKSSYVPQIDNYGDSDLWCLHDDIFLGTAAEFPVNRKSEYFLERKSNGKSYDDYVFCEYDEKYDNLKFYSSHEDNYITVADLSDWRIEWMDTIDSSEDS